MDRTLIKAETALHLCNQAIYEALKRAGFQDLEFEVVKINPLLRPDNNGCNWEIGWKQKGSSTTETLRIALQAIDSIRQQKNIDWEKE